MSDPDHMMDFVQNNDVVEKFKEVAMKRSSAPLSMHDNTINFYTSKVISCGI